MQGLQEAAAQSAAVIARVEHSANTRKLRSMEKRGDSRDGHDYTLLLEDDYFYVGFSVQVETRIAQHFLRAGSKWTRLHKPIRVLSCLPGDHVLERATTIALMCQHGWERVRGGAWCQVQLAACPAPILKAMRYAADYPESCSAPPQEDGASAGADAALHSDAGASAPGPE